MGGPQKALPPGEAQPKAEPQPQVPIEFGAEGVKLQNAEDAWRFASRCFQSNMLPEQITNANQAFVILCRGAELGLPAFSSWNYVYLTKARRLALTTKGALAVVQAKPSFGGYKEWIENEGTPAMKGCAAAQRKGFQWMTKEFSMADADAAGLLKRKRSSRSGEEYDGPWQAFVKDMLLSRARGRVLDLVFAAELGGIPVEGVAEDADRMEAQRNGQVSVEAPRAGALPQSEIRALPPGQSDDPLLSLLEQQPDTRSPALIETISRQVDEMWPREGAGSAPAQAVQEVAPPAGPPPATQPPNVGMKPLGPGDPCPRCKTKLNDMGGCDVCGWPGDDIR